jgi:hypothetical protein
MGAKMLTFQMISMVFDFRSFMSGRQREITENELRLGLSVGEKLRPIKATPPVVQGALPNHPPGRVFWAHGSKISPQPPLNPPLNPFPQPSLNPMRFFKQK